MTDDRNPPPSWGRPPEVEAILAVGSLILFAGVTWVVLFNTIPPQNEKYAMLMLGALIGVVKDTFGRYFQATKGAQDQRKEAAQLASRAAEVAASLAGAPPTGVAAAPEPGTASIVVAPDVDLEIRDAADGQADATGEGELPADQRVKP